MDAQHARARKPKFLSGLESAGRITWIPQLTNEPLLLCDAAQRASFKPLSAHRHLTDCLWKHHRRFVARDMGSPLEVLSLAWCERVDWFRVVFGQPVCWAWTEVLLPKPVEPGKVGRR